MNHLKTVVGLTLVFLPVVVLCAFAVGLVKALLSLGIAIAVTAYMVAVVSWFTR